MLAICVRFAMFIMRAEGAGNHPTPSVRKAHLCKPLHKIRRSPKGNTRTDQADPEDRPLARTDRARAIFPYCVVQPRCGRTDGKEAAAAAELVSCQSVDTQHLKRETERAKRRGQSRIDRGHTRGRGHCLLFEGHQRPHKGNNSVNRASYRE